MFAAILVTHAVAEAWMGDGAYTASGRWQAAACALGGAATAALGFWLNRPRKLITDVDTGDGYTIQARHSFFWIPMQHLGLVIFGVSMIVGLQLDH